MNKHKLIEIAEAQKGCEHRLIQSYENEDAAVQVCVECGYRPGERRRFKIKPGRVFLDVISGFPEKLELD